MTDTIATLDAPEPGGHYAQAKHWGRVLFISGQLPNRPGNLAHDSSLPFAEQARQAVNNLLAVLKAAGGTAEQLAMVRVYLVGVENWAVFNQVYAAILGDAKPARAVVPVPALHHGYLIEVEAVAVGLPAAVE